MASGLQVLVSICESICVSICASVSDNKPFISGAAACFDFSLKPAAATAAVAQK